MSTLSARFHFLGYRIENFFQGESRRILLPSGTELSTVPLDEITRYSNLLYLCCEKNNFELARAILNRDPVQVSYRGVDRKSCLHVAALNASLECLKLVYEKAPWLLTVKNAHGATVMHAACYKGDPACVQFVYSVSPPDIFSRLLKQKPGLKVPKNDDLRCLEFVLNKCTDTSVTCQDCKSKSAFFRVYTNDLTEEKCEYCHKTIGEKQIFSLHCGHVFCSLCISDHKVNLVPKKSK